MLSKHPSNASSLSILPIGGCCRIGLNCTIYKTLYNDEESWILVDFGLGFAEKHLGLDILLPDIHFLKKHKKRIKGICITHGHEDHIGALPYLWDHIGSPVYATGFTRELIEEKVGKSLSVREVSSHSNLTCGPFKIRWINVAHSIPESHALLIESPDKKTILHTGDFKTNATSGDFSYFDEKAFAKLGTSNVLAMVCDSTNAHIKKQTPGEKSVEKDLRFFIKNAPYRIVITLFSSNIERLNTLLTFLKEEKRHVALVGRSVKRLFAVAQRRGLLPSVQELSVFDAMAQPREKVALICAGSQGEERSALKRIAHEQHPHVHLEEGDCVIYSSRTIPGNDKSVGEVKNAFAAKGIRIIDHHDGHIHVSGHPAQEDLTHLYRLVRPRFSIPVHGEPYQIAAHKRLVEEKQLASKVILMNEGQEITFPASLPHDFSPMKKRVAIKTLCLDGTILLAEDDPVLTKRRKMARSGVVVITVLPSHSKDYEKNRSMLLSLSFIGVPEDLNAPAKQVLKTLFERLKKEKAQSRKTSYDVLEKMIKKEMDIFFRTHWKKVPVMQIIFPSSHHL